MYTAIHLGKAFWYHSFHEQLRQDDDPPCMVMLQGVEAADAGDEGG